MATATAQHELNVDPAAVMELAETGDGRATARGERIAQSLLTLEADPQIRAAARLFPLVESGELSARTIEKRLGRDMASLCRALVKLSRFGLAHGWQPGQQLGVSQADALRKMLLATVDDVRLVLVRIADQLCRLQVAKSAPESERRHTAMEARHLFAPLANRLGIWQLKWEMEDLVFRFLEPGTYKRIAGWLAERRVDREDYIARAMDELEARLAEDNIHAEIVGRPKHIYSIYKKMQRKNVGFSHVYDVRALRVLVGTVAECYAVLGAIHGKWPHIPGEFDDYIATPKGNNYQSLHTAVVGPEKKTLEIQIRTHDMNTHAELGVAAHWQYKEGGGRADESFLKKINWLRSLLDPESDSGEGSDSSLIDQMQAEAFEDRIYVLTPGGDIVDLPQGGTPLDFAYHVHTDIGHRCRGAKVDGRMVPLTYELGNGDTVEIIAAKTAQPSRDWLIPQLGYLKSSRARAKARAWFRKQDQEHNASQGQTIFDREMQRLGFEDPPHVNDLARDFGFHGATDLYVALGSGDLGGVDLARAIEKRLEPQDLPSRLAPTRRSLPDSERTHDDGGVQIEGVGDLMTSMAKCCQPVPPDNIVGYITQGRGITIHREDCSNARRLAVTSPERLLSVNWSGGSHRY
ncbi:MAG: bifunctional (p)ppGpp synthetase/guanosine-3',5'-bis(diphosphate) 3'-pyrophosphohydrolase, partial [Pseudomonadota bacterium]